MPLPQYDIMFTDGCIPTNLHNLSDRPANFPTLDTLPREKRMPGYSDAYDGEQSNGLQAVRVNPAVEAALASKATMVAVQPVPVNLKTHREAHQQASAACNNRAIH